MKATQLDSGVAVDQMLTAQTEIILEHRSDGRLWASNGGPTKPVTVHRCFPWSAPTEYVSLRDDEGNEIALVRDTSVLSPAAQAALSDALAVAGFLLEIIRVLEIEEEIEVRTWKVITEQGPRQFQTARDEWPRDLPGGGFVIKDVAGDLYRVANVQTMDARSRKLLWALVD